jgi:cyclophilin family peptidyl-prolyl cis-trans isomerase
MIKKIIYILIIVAAVWWSLSLAGFFKKAEAPADNTETAIVMHDTSVDVDEPYNETLTDNSITHQNINTQEIKDMKAIIKTTKGDIEITLDTRTPETTANFIKLAEQDFYNGVKFHRVIKGFMIQGGDPLSKDETMIDRWGTGGPGYQFNDEIHPENANTIGSISMANAGPNTNGSQFFINTSDNGFLNSKHTVFGRVTAGMEVVTSIEQEDTFPNDRPIHHIEIISIEIIN